MTEPQDLASRVHSVLDEVDQLHPEEELSVYTDVLEQLTELLNAPEDHTPGGG